MNRQKNSDNELSRERHLKQGSEGEGGGWCGGTKNTVSEREITHSVLFWLSSPSFMRKSGCLGFLSYDKSVWKNMWSSLTFLFIIHEYFENRMDCTKKSCLWCNDSQLTANERVSEWVIDRMGERVRERERVCMSITVNTHPPEANDWRLIPMVSESTNIALTSWPVVGVERRVINKKDKDDWHWYLWQRLTSSGGIEDGCGFIKV